ncbi:MAG TPA: chemotaxis protein CheD [Verrucomicrobiae bacterium]|nr:chemotaxis protein CheD [Verrucomicrobiae bacterium]
MKQIVVDIADMAVSGDTDDVLVTYSLGSCLGISVYDPAVRVGGLIHCMLPLSSVDGEKAKVKPWMFVDTGMTVFLQKLFDMGVTKANAIVKVAGGASMLDRQGLFRIGERNMTVFRKVMWKNGMLIKATDVGGEVTRTVRLEISTGRFLIKSNGQEVEL